MTASVDDGFLKSIARAAFEHSVGAGVRLNMDKRAFGSSLQKLKQSQETYGWPLLDLDEFVNLRVRKSTRTLFILGSGSSVNGVSKAQWETIKQHVSIGINHWTLHEFVPDAYAVEPVPDSRVGNNGSSAESRLSHLNHLRLLGRDEVYRAEPLLMCLAPRSAGEHAQLSAIPQRLRARTFIYYRFTPSTRALSNLESDLTRSIRLTGAFPKSLVVPDSGATLARLLTFSLLSGFQRVVLVGIDLTTTYFWEEERSMLVDTKLRAFPQPLGGGIHETMNTKNRPFSIIDVLATFRKIFELNDYSIQLFSADSRAAGVLEVVDNV